MELTVWEKYLSIKNKKTKETKFMGFEISLDRCLTKKYIQPLPDYSHNQTK